MSPTELKTSSERAVLDGCQKAIGYRFKRPELLRAALTHTSGANTRLGSNERMEFLGDSVLGLVTCELLYQRFPEYQEGDLTKVKSVVVSRKTCAQFSINMGLGDFLFMGKGMQLYNEIPTNMLADLFEALVAAIFLDSGWGNAKQFVAEYVEPEIERVAQQAVASNSKSQLQQVAQREFGDTPRYIIIDEQGPDHDKCFNITAEISGHRYPAAWGPNKKDAEMKAAMNALAAISGQSIPHPSN